MQKLEFVTYTQQTFCCKCN